MRMIFPRPAALALLLCPLGLLFSGCARSTTIAGHEFHLGGSPPEFEPQNFHQTTPWLPPELRRVAVLPLTTFDGETLAESTREQLEQLLPVELSRTELFEVVRVTPEQLRRWTGRSRWSVTDSLPPEFFKRVEEQLGCHGVIFAHLTACRSYPPLAMGWKLHLVDTREQQVWWTCDLLYDAGNQSVAHSAVLYERAQQASRLPAADPATILRSPGRFGQYSLAASLETLQRHERNN